MTETQITPHDAMKIAENHPDLTPKERQKVLALALIRIAKNAMEMAILWSFSEMIIKANGYTVPAFDPQFIKNVTENPTAFQDYK